MRNNNTERLLHFACYLFFFLTPSESIALFGDNSSFSVTKLSVIFLFITWLFSKGLLGIKTNGFLKLFGLYFIWAFLTSITSIDADQSLSRVFLFLLPLLVTMITLKSGIDSRQVLRNCMIAFILGSLIPVFQLVYFAINPAAALTAEGSMEERATALGNDQNEMSTLICIAISFVFYILQYAEIGRIKLLLWIFIIVSSVTVLLTGSRTGAIIAIMVVLGGVLGNKGSINRKLILIVISIPVFLFLIQRFVPESNLERLWETEEQLQTRDMSNRGYIWEKGWDAFNNSGRIIQGVGYDMFSSLLQREIGRRAAAHNAYLATIVELGIVGLLLLLFMILNAFKNCIKLIRRNHSFVYLVILIPPYVAATMLSLMYRRWFFIIPLLVCIMNDLEIKEQTKTGSLQKQLQ